VEEEVMRKIGAFMMSGINIYSLFKARDVVILRTTSGNDTFVVFIQAVDTVLRTENPHDELALYIITKKMMRAMSQQLTRLGQTAANPH
jgi:hypothetical protein